jgi:hypothetical protein
MFMSMFSKKKRPGFWFGFAYAAITFKLIEADKILRGIAGNRNAGYNEILVFFSKRNTSRFWAETTVIYYW